MDWSRSRRRWRRNIPSPLVCAGQRTSTDRRVLQVPAPNAVFDGHSVAIIGYEDDVKKPGGGVIYFRNSDGPDWGTNGGGTISYAYLKAYANDALWLVLGAPNPSADPTIRMRVDARSRLGKMPDFRPKNGHLGAPMWTRGEQRSARQTREAGLSLTSRCAKPATIGFVSLPRSHQTMAGCGSRSTASLAVPTTICTPAASARLAPLSWEITNYPPAGIDCAFTLSARMPFPRTAGSDSTRLI